MVDSLYGFGCTLELYESQEAIISPVAILSLSTSFANVSLRASQYHHKTKFTKSFNKNNTEKNLLNFNSHHRTTELVVPSLVAEASAPYFRYSNPLYPSIINNIIHILLYIIKKI